jgi:nucleotide-binding universal stress UspA family protein
MKNEPGLSFFWNRFSHGSLVIEAKKLKEVHMLQEHQAVPQAAGVSAPATDISFSKIMVATDFSPASDRALEFAASIARRFNSKIYLTHVVSVDGYPMVAPEIAIGSIEKLRSEAEAKLARIVESGRLYGIARETLIAEGTLWAAIEVLVENHNIDLLVLGTQGAGGVKKLIVGSGAEQVFRQSRIPVLTVGPHVIDEPLYEAEFKNILFATDFGPGVDREAAYAFALAEENRARITLLNVVRYVDEYSEEAVTSKRSWVTRQLQELVPVKANLTCKPDFLMVIGEPVEEILRWAEKTKADLIVMGAKPRKGLAGHTPHTKAFRVVSGAKCPVLTIKS